MYCDDFYRRIVNIVQEGSKVDFYDFGWIMMIGILILAGIICIYGTIEMSRVDNFCSDLPNIHCQREACSYKEYSSKINKETLEGCMLLEQVYNYRSKDKP